MIALRRVVEKHGVFETLYTDNDSKFKYHRKGGSLYFNYHKNPEDVHTQLANSGYGYLTLLHLTLRAKEKWRDHLGCFKIE